MTGMQRALAEKGLRALESARRTLEDGDAEAAANRAYYACFNLARAALLGVGEQPKTHSGVHNRFALRFVATGRVPEDIARTLPHAAQLRERADYDLLAVTDARVATNLLADAERFAAAVREVVEG